MKEEEKEITDIGVKPTKIHILTISLLKKDSVAKLTHVLVARLPQTIRTSSTNLFGRMTLGEPNKEETR
jgi:hypothetical protein